MTSKPETTPSAAFLATIACAAYEAPAEGAGLSGGLGCAAAAIRIVLAGERDPIRAVERALAETEPGRVPAWLVTMQQEGGIHAE